MIFREPPQILSQIRIKAGLLSTDAKQVAYHFSSGSVYKILLLTKCLNCEIKKINFINNFIKHKHYISYLYKALSSFSSS